MTLIIDPGPLPDDGTRINVDRELDRFINNTNVRNFGPEQFANNQDVNFVVSQTDAPATGARTPGSTLWFKRGEGVMYLWDAQQASESIAQWVAISNRKEMVVHLQSGPALKGSVVWLDTGVLQGQFTEYYGKQVGTNRMVMKVQATEHELGLGNNKIVRMLQVPPFLITKEAVEMTFPVTSFSGVGAGVFTTVVELGYTRAQVVGDGPGAGILQASSPDNRPDAWIVSTEPLGFSNTWGAHVVGSGPVDSEGLQLIFLKSNPANLNW
jgi:hypothetical protein